ncbi:hypothetical protein SDC9_87958 [bioreactor metagenome]|uniref:Uncharacterized protein n=1 Tax=bioreactor metagenome TaxID=1076179 RepID=A0A644ZLS4_9ZZZZ
MSHTLTADPRFGHFYTTFITNNSFVTDALVFATVTFVVFAWSKNFLVKKTVFLWFERAVVDRFWFFDLAMRPGHYVGWRSDFNL